jgi:hypothetical protein
MELFSEFYSHPTESLYSKFVKWTEARKFSFSFALYLSITFHIIIFLILCFSILPSSTSESISRERNQRALSQALDEFRAESPSVSRALTGPSSGKDKKISELLESFHISGSSLRHNEKVQIYKQLISAYFDLKGVEDKEKIPQTITKDDIQNFLRQKGGLDLDSGKKVIPSLPHLGKQDTELNVLLKPSRADLQSLQRFPARGIDYDRVSDYVRVNSPTGIKIVPAQYFFRESPFEQILAQGVHLFHIVEGFPSVMKKSLPDIHFVDTKSDSLFQDQEEKAFKVVLLSRISHSKAVLYKEPEAKEELILTKSFKEHFDDFLDKFLALPEEEQFLYFKKKYLEKYDLESEELAYLTRKFIHSNLNNIIIPVSDISSAFDYIEELYFNRPLEYQFLKFLRENPDTIVSAEFFLTLASHFDFERRAIEYLYNAYDEAKKYLSQKYKVSEVFNKNAKCYIIKNIYEKLLKILEERGYSSLDEVSARYVEEQIDLYEIVINMGGQHRNHGLYDLGCLYWGLGLRDLALATWAQIDGSYESEALNSIKEEMTWYDDVQKAYPRIDRILSWDANRGIKERLKRLIRLGKWKSRSKHEG